GMHLAAPVEEVHALLLRDDGIAVEIGGSLLELGEVFDCAQRPLGAEQPLLRDTAQGRCVDATAYWLRAYIADEVGGGVRVAVGMAIEARYSEARALATSIVREVELLLRKLAHQQA